VNKAKTSLPTGPRHQQRRSLLSISEWCANQHQGHLHVFSGSAATRISALSRWCPSSSMSHA